MRDANLVLFFTASLALIVAPGPDNVLVLTRGVSQGRVAAPVSASGASLGLVVHSAFAAAYLVYLGVRTLLGGDGFVIRNGQASTPELGRIFLQALATNVLNPRVALFFLAFLPQFVGPGTGGVGLQLLLMGLTFALLGLAFLCALACFSGALGNRISDSPAYTTVLRRPTGGVLVGLGLRLAFSGRQ